MSSLNITSGGSYVVDESDLTITISTTEAVTLTGSADIELSEVVITTTADNVNLTINNLNITNASTAIITVGNGSENTLNITGANVFEVANGPGACVNVGGGLTINGTGSFKGTSINGAVIGISSNQQKPDSNITIESGTFDLTCRAGACAIGGAGARGNSIGNITITGTANITASAPSGHASPIGSSYWGSCGDILINGNAKITSTSGQHSAAIGGASLTTVGNITINGDAEVNAINASTIDDSAAIGSGLGSMVQSLGNIVIGGNAKVTASSVLGLAIDNIEWHRENQQYGTTNEGDYPVVNEDTITIGENATFTGTSGDIYTATTINGEEFKAAQISYNSTDGLTYSGGSELDKEALEATLLDITAGGTYTIDEGSVGKILINTNAAVTLQGGNYDLEEIQIIGQSDNINLTINNLQITNKAVSASVIKFGSGKNNKLTVNGDNDFSIATGYSAGINIGGGGTIGGTGSLKVLTLNGAAIGTDGQEDLSTSNIEINSGTFDLEARSGACGIGGAGNGSKIGNITITGTAYVVSRTPQGYAAAIGSAYRGTVGDILINGDATVDATSGIQTAAIGPAVYCESGTITIGGRASVVANTTSTDIKDAAIGGTYGEQVKSIDDIKIIEDATVIASSAHGLAIDNLLYVEGATYLDDYYTVNADSSISFSGDTTTSAQSTVILNNGSSSDIVTIGNRAYQGGKMIFYDGNLAMTGNWTSLEAGGWSYNSVIQMDYLTNIRKDKAADFTLSGGNLKDEDGDGIPDGVSIGSIIYVPQSGVHTGVKNLSGNVIYNGDALGIEGDYSYNIEAISPIDLSEEFPISGVYITDANVTAIRAVSDGATISPRGTAGTSTAADWYAFDNSGGKVTFMDGTYCLYTENQFSSRDYTKVAVSNNNKGVEITTGDDLIQTIGNLNDGYAITIESGINVGEKINFETSGSGVIVVQTTANSGKYSLDADSDEWQFQRYTLGSDNEFTIVFGENGSVTGFENFEGTLQTDDTTLTENTWTTIDGGFIYSGHASNNITKTADITLIGSELRDSNGDGAPDNISVSLASSSSVGIMALMTGLSGEVTLNDNAVGVSGDDDYEVHFTAKLMDNPTAGAQMYAETKEVRGISNGATVNPNTNDIIGFDENAKVHMGDGEKIHLYNKNHKSGGSPHAQIDIDNNNSGVDLTIKDDLLTEIGGLTDGYSVTVISSDNVSNELIFNDIGSGSLEFTRNGKDTVKIDFSGTSSAQSITGKGNALEIIGSSGNDLMVAGATNTTLTGGNGNDTFKGSEGLTNCVIADYTEDEDVIYHGRPFADFSINGSIRGNDYVFAAGGRKIIVKEGADKVIKGVDSNGNTRLFGKYLTLDDNDSATVTAQIGVATIDASLRTENIVVNGNKGDNTIIAGDGKSTVNGKSGDDVLYGTNGKDYLNGGIGNDTLIGGEGNNTLTGGAGQDVFIFTGGNDLITDYKSGADKINLNPGSITNSTVKGSDLILTTGNGNLTVKGAKDKVVTLVDDSGNSSDKIFFADTSYAPLETGLSYDSKRTILTASSKFTGNEIDLENYLATVTKVNAFALTTGINIVGNAENNSLKGGKNADTINGGDGKDTIFGKNGDDSIFGGADNDKLLGDAGNDTLDGGAGNDTLTGGAGQDVFIFTDGNDLITDYKSGADKINLNPGSITNSTVKGSDLILTTGNGNLTVKGAKDKVVTLVDDSGNSSDKIFFAGTSYAPLETGLSYDSKRTILTASSKFGGNEIDLENYLSTVTKVKASAVNQALNIVGNTSANSIKGGKGADTLNGGAGNDTLTGGKGNDVFVYEGGNDIITDYTAGQDSIKISGNISNVSYSGKNVIFTIDDGTLTVNNAKGKDIAVTDSSNQTQTYSKTLEILYDNNFITDEIGIDAISKVTDTNYSVGQIESNDKVKISDSIVSASTFDKK